MKRFITAILFSLTVIVCEQQTLFAALSVYTNVASVTADSEEGHRGIPIAGVNRLIPVAESFVTSNVDLASTTNDCPNIMHPPGFKSRVPVAGYDCQGKGTYTDSGDDDLNGVIIITIDDMPFLEFFDVDHGNAY